MKSTVLPSVGNNGWCKFVGRAAKGSYDGQFATPFASLWSTAPWLEEQSVLLGYVWLDKVIRIQIWSSKFLLALSHPSVFILRARKQIEFLKKSFTLGNPESVLFERVGSHKECYLVESSMVSSSPILVSFLILQRFCKFTQMHFMWRLCNNTQQGSLIWRSFFPDALYRWIINCK